MNRYGQNYYQAQMTGAAEQPIIEVNGKLRFSLPGTPIFPDLTDDTILKPRLEWHARYRQAGKVSRRAFLRHRWHELAGRLQHRRARKGRPGRHRRLGHNRQPERQDIRQRPHQTDGGRCKQNSARNEPAADAADDGCRECSHACRPAGHRESVRRIPPLHARTHARRCAIAKPSRWNSSTPPASTKQLYIYDGAKIDPNRYNGWNWENIRNDHSYGTESNPKIWVMREFVNSQANHLGMPLPKGRVRFYRHNDDGQVEFTGENLIDHTPKDETVRIYTGNAFDVTGERRRTNYTIDMGRPPRQRLQIKVRNHKKESVDVRVVEHLYRGTNWEIVTKSDDYQKKDSQTIEFPVTIPPDGEKTITYTAHYTW